MQLVVITRETHAGKSWRPGERFDFAAKICMAPVVRSELSRAALAMPIAFVKEGEGYGLAAVMSLKPDDNVFVGPAGQWLGAYTPAFLRSHPFALAITPEKPGEKVLGMDVSFPIAEGTGPGFLPFFDDAGELSAPLKQVIEFFGTLEHDRIATAAALKSVEEAGLIMPWKITLRRAEGEQSVAGLYRIDETALNALDDTAFLALRKAGALPVVYTQLLSTGQLEMLDRVRTLRDRMSKPTLVDSGVFPKARSSNFQLRDEDTLQFE